MTRRIVLLLLFMGFLLLVGCAGMYSASIELVSPSPTDGLSYSDDNLKISFYRYVTESIEFRLENVGDKKITVLWDEAIFVDPQGIDMRVVAVGDEDIDGFLESFPQELAPDEVIEDKIIPRENIYFRARSEDWHVFQIVPTETADLSFVRNFQGEMISLIVPVEIGGEVREYQFDFLLNLSLFRWS